MWASSIDYLNIESGKHESQFEALSTRLYNLTFWGDYGGDIVSRFHYVTLQEAAPTAVQSVEGSWGQGLILRKGAGVQDLHWVITFLAYMDPNSQSFGDYPIFEELGSFSDWEWELSVEEMTNGWWAEYTSRELAEKFEDWTDNTLVPEGKTPEWGRLVNDYFNHLSETGEEYEYPYWESADSIIVHGWDVDKVATWLLEQYAATFANCGNPPAIF